MKGTIVLAWRTLVRRPRRLILFVAGVTVASATLIDMVMLAEGLQRSLAELLEATGYGIRATPRGLLPFEGGARIPAAAELVAAFRADPRVEEVAPLWGQTAYVSSPGSSTRPLAAFALGAPAGTAPTMRIREGRAPQRPGQMVIDGLLAAELGLGPGDTLWAGLDPDPAVGALRSRSSFVVSGIADFVFAAEGSANLALRLEDLRELAGTPERQPASLILVRVRPDADAFAVARDFRAHTDRADIYAIPEIIEAAGDRMSYFQQLSLVLGTVSLAVAFLLVATLLTLSVNERWGELAALRAVGVTRGRTLIQIAVQGLVISAAGAVAGLLVGLVVAHYLDAILTGFPGLPAAVSFFVLTPEDVALSTALLIGTGLLAGLYPAWRAASVNIALALRGEMI